MRVVWTVPARRDLEDIKRHIERRNPAAAKRIAQRIRTSISLVRENPGMGRIVPPEVADIEGVHELVVPDTRYVIPYVVAGDRIVLLRVWNTERGELW